ncbi:uncharacterized protein LOC143920802 [Arctopsyche grandis]|uniref:uncharacterized protein LOC143920802 n=1 Tax=Arctopsyche grandis TaxID=121162 RepID=UPI00406D6E04
MKIKMDVIQNVVIEMRPRLCSCNVVIITNPGFAEKYHLKVSVRPNYIIVNYTDYQTTKKKSLPKRRRSMRTDSSSSYESYSDSEEESYSYSKFINITSHCKLIPSSLSSLKIEDNFISFRILTEPIGPNSSGTFFNEVFNDSTSNVPVDDGDRNFCLVEKLSIFLKKSVKVKLQCSNCSNDMFKIKNNECDDAAAALSFNRILELPSDNLDMSEWFCHKHDHGNESGETLAPSETDVYYGLYYFLVNAFNIKQSLVDFNKKRNIVHCERCFSWLGVKLHDSTCFQFWDSCVKFVENIDSENKSTRVFRFFHRVAQPETANVALSNFICLIKYAIKNTVIDSMTSTCKIMFECKMTSDSIKCILVWIMDRNLDILKTKSYVEGDNQNEIKLDRVLTSKLLYKIDDNSEMVKNWSNDSLVQSFDISKDMFLEGSKHLSEMSCYIPHSFRNTNDFFVSYLKI